MILGIGIALLQLFDMYIHAATDQLEILRVASNMIILLWLAIPATGKFNAKSLPAAIGAIASYLILNFVFLAREGLTNPQQGGGLRVTLLLLVFLTVALSTLLTFIQNRRASK